MDFSEPIYTPTLNCHDYLFSGEPAKTTEELLEAAHQRIEELEAALHKQTIYFQLKPTAQNMYSWLQMQHLRNKGIANVEGLRKTMQGCKLSLFDQFYLVLQKLRVGTLNQVLADTFNISQTTVSRVFISWITFLYFMLGSTCIWPSQEKIQKNMPICFKSMYPDCRGIVDASEIKVQAP